MTSLRTGWTHILLTFALGRAALGGCAPAGDALPGELEPTGSAGMAGVELVREPRDVEGQGYELNEVEEPLDSAAVDEDFSVVPRSLVPPEVIADLNALERGRLIDKAVIGREGRVAVLDTEVDPYKTVVRLFTRYAKDGKASGCTGTLIAPTAVLTAAHCVFNSSRATPGHAYSVTVVPGMYPKDPLPASGTPYEAPFGTASAKKAFLPNGYIRNEADAWNRIPYDYAVIRLSKSLGAVGTKPFDVMPEPLNKVARLIGYHSDKERNLRMYSSRDQVRKVLSNGTFNHYMDSDKGSSGSGITGGGGWEDKIFGVNSSEVEGATPYNIAVTITGDIRKVIADWAVRPL